MFGSDTGKVDTHRADETWYREWKRRKADAIDLERLVCSIVAYQTGVPPEKIGRSTLLVEDLGADSLDLLQITIELEEELSLDMPDEDAEGIRSVGDILRILERRLNNAAE